ncbi:hypothetical protein N0V83_010120 [Neocucurbitaria cava]|uniref:Uncharacterized protein n=1 Tax=Neocucurbitaria cava TaxID=798079 RepID=A0A9W8Y047_9PLEO|nr:hypothetical protein N0V83_010120 [Neocucurbitaria cava]
MFENERDSDALTNVNCGVSSLNWSYFRNRPVEATTTSSTSTNSPSTPASTPAVSTPTSTSAIPTLISRPDGGEKKESKAWIAGAVIGPLVGLALIGLGVFLFLRRKKNKQAQPAAPPAAFSQHTYPPGPNSPPQYYPPPMQQNAGAPGMVPYGVTKHDSWAGGQQSPVTQGSMSPSPQNQNPYGAASPQQGWQGQNNMQINQAPPAAGGQPVYGGSPSPSMSPQAGYAQPGQYGGGGGGGGENGMYKHTTETVRPFSSELEGSSYAGHGQPEQISAQPKIN